MRPLGLLWDIGGPIDTETESEAAMDAALQRIAGTDISAANDAAIASFAPNTYQAMLWTLMGNAAPAAWAALVASPPLRPFQLRPGIAELLRALADRGVPMGLAANQPASVHVPLRDAGILDLFRAQDVSGTIGLRKPDPRLFLHACGGLGLLPEQTVMIGDRIDNDIAPARLLGMGTILFRTGRHARQQPRSWLETPDYEVADIEGLREAIWQALELR